MPRSWSTATTRTRAQARLAAGRRPAADVPPVEFVECATLPAVLARLGEGGIDVCVLDGGAAPAGGMGVCRQIKDEVFRCRPVLLIGRPQDAWPGTWSRADAAVTLPRWNRSSSRRPWPPCCARPLR